MVTPGLGDNTYVVTSGGEAAVIDPQRDAARFLDVAEARGATIRYVLETHVHNDYVSGAMELQKATGAEVVAPAGGGYRFPVREVAEGDEIRLGDVRLVAMETPGHTPEHVSYLLYQRGSDVPSAVFTGGSLMVEGAGRTDLLGPDRTDELTRAQYRTLQRLARLTDEVRVLPTHGAGSFCGAAGPPPANRTSTVGRERVRNGALQAKDEDAFIARQLRNLQAYPTYYRHMAGINRSGPDVLGGMPTPPALDPEELAKLLDRSVWLVDARFRAPFARAHVPGSVNVELDETFSSYVGWVVPFNDPIALVVPEPEEGALEEAVTQLLRIGYERIEGYLKGGLSAWRSSGRPVASYRVAGLEELCRAYRQGRHPSVLDVRQRTEWDEGHLEGSRHLFVGDLAGAIDQVPSEQEQWVICATGHRASTAASMLDREGIPARLVDGTGVTDVLKHCPPPG